MADGSSSVENEIFRRKRETFWISVPRCVRADEIQCTVESSADISHIGRQGTDAEGDGRMWLGNTEKFSCDCFCFLRETGSTVIS